jgi:hypothetical protein
MDTIDFSSRLLRSEKIVWSGSPAQGLLLRVQDWMLIPFSLLWGGFAIFWESSVWVMPAPVLMRLWGVPFVLIGLYFIVGRFFVDAWARSATQYAVTNKRVLIARSGPFSKFIALGLDQMQDATLSERADGSGTIRFGQRQSWGRRGSFSSWTPALDPTPQFIAIENSRSVFDQIQSVAQKDTGP